MCIPSKAKVMRYAAMQESRPPACISFSLIVGNFKIFFWPTTFRMTKSYQNIGFYRWHEAHSSIVSIGGLCADCSEAGSLGLRLHPLGFLLRRLPSSYPSRSRASNGFVLVAVMEVAHNWECSAADTAAADDSKT